MKRELMWVWFACLLALPLQGFAESCPGDSKDTVIVKGREVVFYSLSHAQLDLLPTEDQEAYNELLSDFYEYTGQLGRYLDKHGIKHFLTGSRYLEVKVGRKAYCYDKAKFKEEVGVILSDGKKPPQIIPGLFTDREVVPTIAKYYLLK